MCAKRTVCAPAFALHGDYFNGITLIVIPDAPVASIDSLILIVWTERVDFSEFMRQVTKNKQCEKYNKVVPRTC